MNRHPRRWLVLAILCLALCMVVIDNTILSIALPSISHELGASETGLQWISTSYGLVLSGLLLPLAVLGDRFGRKGLFLTGLAIFGVASAAAAFSATTTQLAVLRGVMGVGGACTMPATLAILGNVFDEDERAHAIGIWAGIAGLAAAAGPVIGGFLVERYWWGSVLLVNLPIAAVALVAGARYVPTSKDPNAPPMDGPGSLLWTAALASFLFAVIEGPVLGWLTVPVVAGFVLAAALVVAFVRRERVAPGPILAPATARHPAMRAGATTMTATFFAVFGGQFVLTQWLQGPRGMSALAAGACFAPQAVCGLIASLSAPRLAARIGQVATTRVALAALTVGFVVASAGVWVDSIPFALAGFAVAGFGLGGGAAAVELIMSSEPPERAGSAAGVNETIVEAAGAVGVAVLGSVLASGAGFAAPLPIGAGVALVASYVVSRVSRAPRPASQASMPVDA